MSDRQTRKRVVLLLRSGLHRIVGVYDPSVHELHEFIDFGVIKNDKGLLEKVEASLMKVQPRFVLYRQVMQPPASGRLGEFNPRQQ